MKVEFETHLAGRAALDRGQDAMPEEALSRVIAQIPVGRLGEPDEIARVVEFLADPDSGYITGEVYGINGGLYM